jgi:hypothetical protein
MHGVAKACNMLQRSETCRNAVHHVATHAQEATLRRGQARADDHAKFGGLTHEDGVRFRDDRRRHSDHQYRYSDYQYQYSDYQYRYSDYQYRYSDY